MDEQFILKNVKKYNRIRFKTDLKLDNSPISLRRGNIGLSTEKFGWYWFMLPKGKAIFKTYDDPYMFMNRVGNIRLVNELICYEISKQVGVLCAEYEPATHGKNIGVVTYDVAKENEKMLNLKEFYDFAGCDFSVNGLHNFSVALDKLVEQGYKLDKRAMQRSYFKVVMFDILTVQSDRHKNNVHILIDEKNKTIRFSPIIDNEFAFNVAYLEDMIMEHSIVRSKDFIEQMKEISVVLTLREERMGFDMYNSNLTEIMKIIKQNPNYESIFKDMVKNFDVKKAIENVKKQGVKISLLYERYLIMAERIVKSNIKKELKKEIENDNKYNFLNRPIEDFMF